MRAIILAGGKGTRLAPFTKVLPKPLLPVGNFPILEIIIKQLARNGFNHITLMTGYLEYLIKTFFGDGNRFGLTIDYSSETEPLGTAGPLTNLKSIDEPFLLMNGDLLTTLNFKEFYNFHISNKSSISIFSHQKKVKIDLGILETDQNNNFISYNEKPEYSFEVSSGIYILEPSVIGLIPKSKFDLPDLVRLVHAQGENISIFNKPYEWLDMGNHDDYQIANEIFSTNQDKYLPK